VQIGKRLLDCEVSAFGVDVEDFVEVSFIGLADGDEFGNAGVDEENVDFAELAGQSIELMNDALPVMQFHIGSGKANEGSRVTPIAIALAWFVARSLTTRLPSSFT